MAQLNITLNQEEILQLLSNDRNEVFRKLLESSLNSVLKAESQEQLKAHPYERSYRQQKWLQRKKTPNTYRYDHSQCTPTSESAIQNNAF